MRRKINKKIVSLISLAVIFGEEFYFHAEKVSANWTAGLNNASMTGLPAGSVFGIIMTIADWLLSIIGIVGVVGFVIAGLIYLTAAGEEKKITTAKGAMMASIYGVIVALAGLVVIFAANNLLNGVSF